MWIEVRKYEMNFDWIDGKQWILSLIFWIVCVFFYWTKPCSQRLFRHHCVEISLCVYDKPNTVVGYFHHMTRRCLEKLSNLLKMTKYSSVSRVKTLLTVKPLCKIMRGFTREKGHSSKIVKTHLRLIKICVSTYEVKLSQWK